MGVDLEDVAGKSYADLFDGEDHNACGLAASIDLEGVASNRLVRDTLDAGRRLIHRAGILENEDGTVASADGAGLLLKIDKEQLAERLTERERRNLGSDLNRLQEGVFHFDRDLHTRDTRKAIDASLEREGLTVLHWEKTEVDESILSDERKRKMPKYRSVLYLVDGTDPVRNAREIFTVGRRINSDIRNVRIGSLALDRKVLKGLLTPDELSRYFKDLNYLKAVLAIVHDRYATNVATADHLTQPFGTVAHNGEINSIVANRKALLNLARLSGFFNKVWISGGSDSAHLNDAAELMLANGVTLLEVLMRLLPPALKKIGHKDFEAFIRASKRAMGSFGMWEGPAAVFATDAKHFVAKIDRAGFRPVRIMRHMAEGRQRFSIASEMGAFAQGFENITLTGQMKAGEGLAVDIEEGKVLQGEALFDYVLESTGLNWKQLDGSKSCIIVPESLERELREVKEVKLDAKEVRANKKLVARLAGFGWHSATIDSAVTRIAKGKAIISSFPAGRLGPLKILDPTLSSVYDLYKAKAAIITNPPMDPEGEADLIEDDILLGRMPGTSPEKRNYNPVYPQWHLPSPIVPVAVLNEMVGDSSIVDLGHSQKPLAKVIDTTFTGYDYGLYTQKIEQITDEVVRLAKKNNSHSVPIIVLSDREAFSGNPPKNPIEPLRLVQSIKTALMTRGLARKLSVVVDSGTIRSAHDMGVLIAHGANGVCPRMLDEVARMADDPKQALYNLYLEEEKELQKMMSKLGITTHLGIRNSYCFSATGLAPEVVNRGGAKITSKVGGLSARGVFEHLVLSQIERFKQAEEWMKKTYLSKGNNPEGAYDDVTRELFNMVAHPNIMRLRELFDKEACPQLYAGQEISRDQLSDIALQAAIGRTDDKILNLRDLYDLQYEHQELTAAILDSAPSVEDIFEHMFMSHMSLGAHGDPAHSSMVRGANLSALSEDLYQRYLAGEELVDPEFEGGVLSASGEGGEQWQRRKDGPWAMDRCRAKQIGTAGWGVDLKYLMEADEICIKIAQGAKPGEGGDLPQDKVNEFIAEIRHVRAGTRLISPPPNHDIYSIEDLKARIRGLRALNPGAKISIKVAAMPGLGQIAVGAVKSGANSLEISGYDAGTAAAGEQSMEYCGWTVEEGLAEAHQYLVAAGIRNRMQLRADGRMRTPKDLVKMMLLGADGVGFGTLMMLFVQCIACVNCHTNKCPKGITTQDWDRIKKLYVKFQRAEMSGEDKVELREILVRVGADGVRQGLFALARGVRNEMALLGVTKDNFKGMVGDVAKLRQRETGDPVMDSLDLETQLLKVPLVPEGKGVEGVLGYVRESCKNVYENPLMDRVMKDVEPFLTGEVERMELVYNIENTDREFAVPLAGQMYERLVRSGKLSPVHRITLNTAGYGGHNYGFAIGEGISLNHEGYLNDSVGQWMSGSARIVVKLPENLRGMQAQSLVGNQAGKGASGGVLYCGSAAGERFGVRNSGATLVAEAVLDYPFEYMTDGRGMLLGDFVGVIGSRMTGGELCLYDPDGDRTERIDKRYIRADIMEDNDLVGWKKILEDYALSTGNVVAKRILADWSNESGNFVKIVPRKEAKSADVVKIGELRERGVA